ncbi:RBBP9/YdeN family alpha/beta hydrolase [Arvimicrobium flavum]|uniref:RBBP9/YdeN family alpha/beta hydrolase n=1 Tax=Arvimicrobium flavum TaxID=3393320 RepID=UPI00237B7418|nr:alpha/beta hydrolase [Mesorhizobium shangrilense]
MKASEADIVIVPGLGNSGPDHWQSRWETRLSTARRVVQDDWLFPEREPWVSRVADTVNRAERPVVLVAHSLGVPTAINAIPKFETAVRGALFVAPPDLERPNLKPKMAKPFGPYSRDPLPFPSITIASRNDFYCDFAVAEELADAWGSLLVDAGEAGHIDAESGFGPWPEGSLMLAKLLSRL